MTVAHVLHHETSRDISVTPSSCLLYADVLALQVSLLLVKERSLHHIGIVVMSWGSFVNLQALEDLGA